MDGQVISFTAPDANILIVDDVEINLDITSCLLEPLQMNIDTALSGAEAIELVRQKNYDLIFMDHMMPEMDGIEAKRRIGEISDVPVIALTANDGPDVRDKFINLGFCDFITKPVEADILERLLLKWLPKEKIVLGTAEHAIDKDIKFDILIDGIDTDTAKKYATSMEMYKQSLETYVSSVPTVVEKIASYRNADDIENYTITVHGLKSSSKIIGATEISEKARELENFGHDGESAKAYAGADELISMLCDISERIKTELGIDNKAKTLSDDELKAAIADLKEIAENFDMAGLLRWENEYSFCTVSSDKVDGWKDILSSVHDVAFSEIYERIENMMHIS
jgi:CheY-like chemotaxis protein